MDFVLREVTVEDFSQVLHLWESVEGVVLTDTDDPPNLEDYLSRNPGLSTVAEFRGELIAVVLCGHDGRRGYLHHLAVRADSRNRGVGRAMVDRCMERLAGCGIKRCNLFILNDHATARDFWQRDDWIEWPEIRLLQKETSPQNESTRRLS